MSFAWRTMEWVTALLDIDDDGGGGGLSHRSDTIADMVLSDQGKAVAIGLSMVCMGIGLAYYAAVYATKLVGWFFRFVWKLAFALLLTILISMAVSLAVPWAWAGVAAVFGTEPPAPQHPYGRGAAAVDPSDMIYVYMSDGTLHPIPKWSEIGTRERVRRQAEAQWGFLDRILGFKPWSTSRGGGFWGTLFGFNGDPKGEWDTPHIARSIISPSASDMAWGGTKLAAQFVASACTNIGRGAVTRVAGAIAALSETREDQHSEL